jgi:hypothetical protein
MENRDRDKVSRNTQSTEAGDVNRQTSSNVGKDKNDTSADFGQNIGRSENLNEPNQRTGNNWDEPGGKNSGSGSMKGSSSNRDTSDLDRDRDSSMGSNTGSSSTSGSDSGRH